MRVLTPRILIEYVKDYDYEITKEQAIKIMDLLEEEYGFFMEDDILRATDYIMNGNKSLYANYFE